MTSIHHAAAEPGHPRRSDGPSPAPNRRARASVHHHSRVAALSTAPYAYQDPVRSGRTGRVRCVTHRARGGVFAQPARQRGDRVPIAVGVGPIPPQNHSRDRLREPPDAHPAPTSAPVGLHGKCRIRGGWFRSSERAFRRCDPCRRGRAGNGRGEPNEVRKCTVDRAPSVVQQRRATDSSQSMEARTCSSTSPRSRWTATSCLKTDSASSSRSRRARRARRRRRFA